MFTTAQPRVNMPDSRSPGPIFCRRWPLLLARRWPHSLGIAVVSLPAVPDLPDTVFVEDPVIVLDEVAIMSVWARNRGVANRPAWRKRSRDFVRCVGSPNRRTLEGGDVVRIGFYTICGKIDAQQRRGHCAVGRRTEAAGIQGAVHGDTKLLASQISLHKGWAIFVSPKPGSLFHG
jgi:hypothetical protein